MMITSGNRGGREARYVLFRLENNGKSAQRLFYSKSSGWTRSLMFARSGTLAEMRQAMQKMKVQHPNLILEQLKMDL